MSVIKANGSRRDARVQRSEGKYDIIVVGGGAAGMMASATAAQNGARVLLAERNDAPGQKLSISGKGRCNLTNNCSVLDVVENVLSGGRFLQSALYGLTPGDTMRFFESIGVNLVTERGGRVFPASGKASDVVLALRGYLEESGVAVKRARVYGLDVEKGRISGARTDGEAFKCAAAVLSTGGLSYPGTGSTGDGYDMAKALGHTITPVSGSLAPIVARCEDCGKMQGLTLKNVRLSLYDGGSKPIFSDFGELLFTHYGVSGPLGLSASAHIRGESGKKAYIILDLKPALDEKTLDARVLRDFTKYSNRDFQNALVDLLPKSMIPVLVERSSISAETKVNVVNREQRLRLVREMKNFRIDVKGLRPIDEAIVTAGGVALSEINPRTMESKIVEGLYFAGEIIDADAYTGGYNLQIAWSTAFAAGRAAAERIRAWK